MAIDGYMEIAGIKGESTDEAHPDWIEVYDLDLEVKQEVSMTSREGFAAKGRPTVTELKIVKRIDKSTPSLIQQCLLGRPIPTVNIDLVRSIDGEKIYMQYQLKDAMVSYVSPMAQDGSDHDRPYEVVRFAFTKIKWIYHEFDNRGTKKAEHETGWDLEVNQVFA